MMHFSGIRCIAFDLDDTLWPCEPTITNSEIALYEWLKENFPKITEYHTLQELREHRQAFAERNPDISYDVTALRLGALKELAQQFGYQEDMAHAGLALFRQYRNQVEFYDDSLPTLNRLAKTFQIGAITNGNADLNAIGVSHYFDFFITAEQVGVAKPSIKIFEHAKLQTNLASHELLYVGDHPSIDIVGANQSGWRSIWLNRNQQLWPLLDAKPDAEIHSLSDLLELL